MPFTQADLDAIDTSLKGGVAQVTYPDGRSVRYHSLDELIRVRALVAGEVNAVVEGTAGGSMTTYASTSRE